MTNKGLHVQHLVILAVRVINILLMKNTNWAVTSLVTSQVFYERTGPNEDTHHD